jgi:hypothetical protein
MKGSHPTLAPRASPRAPAQLVPVTRVRYPRAMLRFVATCVFLVSVNALGQAAAPAAPQRDWSVAKVTLKSGNVVFVSLRNVAPAGKRASFPSRESVRCVFADRGDSTGLPTKEALAQLQALEVQLESKTAIRLMSKTGDGARESVFQATNSVDFKTALEKQATALGLQCTVEAAADTSWALWDATRTQLLAPPK